MSIDIDTEDHGQITINKTCNPHKLHGCKHFVQSKDIFKLMLCTDINEMLYDVIDVPQDDFFTHTGLVQYKKEQSDKYYIYNTIKYGRIKIDKILTKFIILLHGIYYNVYYSNKYTVKSFDELVEMLLDENVENPEPFIYSPSVEEEIVEENRLMSWLKYCMMKM